MAPTVGPDGSHIFTWDAWHLQTKRRSQDLVFALPRPTHHRAYPASHRGNPSPHPRCTSHRNHALWSVVEVRLYRWVPRGGHERHARSEPGRGHQHHRLRPCAEGGVSCGNSSNSFISIGNYPQLPRGVEYVANLPLLVVNRPVIG